MPITIEEFYEEFLQEIHAVADSSGMVTEDVFFEDFCKILVEQGEIDQFDRVRFARTGLRVDGYAGDPRENEGELCLIVADFQPDDELTSLTASSLDAIFRRALKFVSESLKQRFRERLEETAPVYGLSDLIDRRWKDVSRVRILLISSRRLSERVDGRQEGEIEGVPVRFSLWDINRLHLLMLSGKGHEDIVVDFEEDFGGGLPALAASEAGEFESYLTIIRGDVLAGIYDRWGARLLEQNVRVFLQARNKVNKGIRITLENQPEMFFAFNNGLAATAEEIEVDDSDGEAVINSLKNLQIVNGGQTTASIFAASRSKTADVSKVFVQMKLSVIPPESALEVVPKISEYANSQNRVNAADFFANHPFHVRMEGFSRRIYAPAKDGSFRQSKWFYERARGQYQDAQAHLTKAAKAKFRLEYPKTQMFTKTDLAKFVMLWRQQPHVVSKGAQKNFAEFAQLVGREWETGENRYNEMYYKEAVAKAIIFRTTEALVTKQVWYSGGYRANIVAYALAKIAHDTEALRRSVDFDSVWGSQMISEAFEKAIQVAAEEANAVLTAPPPGIVNVTEWAKKEKCWERMQRTVIDWPDAWIGELVSQAHRRAAMQDAVTDQKITNGAMAMKQVVEAGPDLWKNLLQWGTSKRLFSPKEVGILEVCSIVPAKVPSEKQSLVALETLEKAREEGFQGRLE